MWRLRSTVGLSLLALGVGIAGTAWLSTFTDQWDGPPGQAAPRPDKVRAMLRRHARAAAAPPAPAPVAASSPAPLPAEPELTPLEMPPLPASLWSRDAWGEGKVELSLRVDGEGHVQQASVVQSSGDNGLDARALRTVQRWRFAVPADRPQGLSGRLVMRFAASVPTP